MLERPSQRVSAAIGARTRKAISQTEFCAGSRKAISQTCGIHEPGKDLSHSKMPDFENHKTHITKHTTPHTVR